MSNQIQILSISKDAEGLFHAFDSVTNAEITGEDAPRQIMMQLADKHGETLYRKNKKWRRTSDVAKLTPAPKAPKAKKAAKKATKKAEVTSPEPADESMSA